MRKYLYFDSMLTPLFITWIYWVLLVGVAWSGLGMIFGGPGPTLGKLISGLIMMLIGAVSARIWCELLIVIFKIHENIKRMAEK
jgi:hypothetical protein